MSEFVVRNPDYERDVREGFAAQGLMHTLGVKILNIAPGAVDLAVDHQPGLLQANGFFHAGVSTTLADTAAGYAAFSLFEKGAHVLSIEFKINLLSPAVGQRLIARGRVERAGKTITVCRADVYAETDGVEKPVATGLFTMMKAML